MTYDPENCSIVLTDYNGKEYHITGFADADLKFEQMWHRIIGVQDDGSYIVYCMDNNFCGSTVHITKEVYDKYIKDLKPSAESPFSFNRV
jgi:hypothetical protein